MGYIILSKDIAMKGGNNMCNNCSEENSAEEMTNAECTMKCECCSKKKERSPEEYKRLINRLNRISGQINGIKGMVEKDAYCTDILIQVAAVNAALNSFNKELLASHIRSCVAENIRNGNDEVIDELVQTLQRLMK
jgi:DNA-binding FrmR family transcriptional regulator